MSLEATEDSHSRAVQFLRISACLASRGNDLRRQSASTSAVHRSLKVLGLLHKAHGTRRKERGVRFKFDDSVITNFCGHVIGVHGIVNSRTHQPFA
jgi:hypothetical protein